MNAEVFTVTCTCDATEEWREVSIFTECCDTAEAIFAIEYEQEPRGVDDVGDWRAVFDLIGLRVTAPNGSVVTLGRSEARDALGPVTVAALEQMMFDAKNIE